jgi:hypothetical protein
VDVQYPSQEPGRDNGTECDVETEEVEDAIVAHGAKVIVV